MEKLGIIFSQTEIDDLVQALDFTIDSYPGEEAYTSDLKRLMMKIIRHKKERVEKRRAQ